MVLILIGAAAIGGVKVYRDHKKKKAIKKQNAAAQASQKDTDVEYAFPPNGGRSLDDDVIPPPYERATPMSPVDEPQIQPPDYSDHEEESKSATVPKVHLTDYSTEEDASLPVPHVHDTDYDLYGDEDLTRPPIPRRSSARKAAVVSPLNFNENA